jgi:flagellar hook protein FlgE
VPDASGNLVNAAGYYLMGYNVQNGPADVSANSLSGMQKVNVTSVGEQAVATTSGTLNVNLPSTATAVAAANLPSTNTAGATYTEKTSLVAYDNLGGAENIDLYMTKTGANTWEVAAYNKADAATGGGFPYSAGPLATQTLTFSGTTGQLTSSPTLALTVPNGQPMTLDLTGATQLAAAYAVNAASTNGNAPNSVSGVQITTNGTLSYQYANGTSVAAYDIPLASVPSPDNLTSLNGDVFQVNLNSGQALVGTAGSAGLGTINSSSLEQSTVDLATELTQMISAQSAYQANSKVFQTGADILDILNNLKS